LDEREVLGARESLDVRAVHLYRAGIGLMQSQYRPKQYGFARTGAANHPKNLTPADLEIETIVHDLRAEAVDQAMHANHRIGASDRH
jgi:hypothetical protein